MRKLIAKALFLVSIAAVFSQPLSVSAHEVYVLDHQEIANAVAMPSPNPLSAIPGEEKLFLMYGAAIGFAVILVLILSVSPLFERVFDPWLMKLKPYAPFIARITLGLSILASGYYGATFGPELPLSQLLPSSLVPAFGLVLAFAGIFIILGLLTRVIALLGVALFAALVWVNHSYMLTYVSYLGEFVLISILGGGMWSLDSHIPMFKKLDDSAKKLRKKLEPVSFFIMRILFGISLFWASFYSKFWHSNLALDTISDYHLTNYFHFSPLFLVLGAFMVEAVIGAFFALGIEVRLTAIVFTFFLTLSILFFGESVWPHVILFGVNLVIFFHGYDRYTVETACLKAARDGEPVL
jgi:uncharacterized membrane protein YphA (DoxX/SURF4 family)